jgi:hypothetical protein
MVKIVDFFKKIVCYGHINKNNKIEWFIYFIIVLILFTFIAISVYNIVKLYEFHEDNILLKYGLNIAIECMLIFIGFFIFRIISAKGRLSNLQLCFCYHVAPFLIITGITAVISTSKRVEIFLKKGLA